ncbi:MAG TPA: hypothetical protein VFH70_07550 [Acidimicrobiales bacterium]|nr:hypothetical protein [Acidimicrobiales bacterium]
MKDHGLSRARLGRLTLAAVIGGGSVALFGGTPGGLSVRPAAAAVIPVLYTASAHAPVMQITEDEPTANFHPEGEGDYGYTIVTGNGNFETAMAANVWPGSAAGNAGTLAEVLGAPSSAGALNDPAQASAASGSKSSQTVSAPSGTTMSASVQPSPPYDQHTTATSSSAGGGLGKEGTVGDTSSTSTIGFRSDTGLLSVQAESSASHIDIAGVVRIGSVTSSASAVAPDGATPTLTGKTDFHDMTIAGEPAYVDGSGVHMGTPGKPAGPAEMEAVDAALASSGMKIYSSSPQTINVGGVYYYTSASILFYWLPPGSHNTFTMSLGGSGVAVSDGLNPAFVGNPPATTPFTPPTGPAAPLSTPVPAVSGPAPVVSSPVTPSQPPAVATTPGGTSGMKLDLPAAPGSGIVPAGARLPGGIGLGWFVLAALLGLAAAALTTRVPALLSRQAGASCPRATSPRRSFGR